MGETARQRRASGGTPGNLNSVTLPEARTLRYLTDAENRRVAKLVDGTIQRAWLYQDSLKPIAELDADGFVTSRFIYASRSNVPDVMLQGDTTYALISDVRGSVRLVVDAATGEVAQRIDYGPFGEVLSDTNPGFQPFGFAGGLYDPDTGFVRFGARDYDASVGRWLSKDPILWTGNQANLYVYVSNDPINGIDPSGLVNPIKLAVGVVNWGRGLKSFVVGLTTMATGVAAAPILGTIWWSRRLRLRGTPARGRCWRNAARNAAIRGVAHRAHRRNFHQEPGRLTTIGPAH